MLEEGGALVLTALGRVTRSTQSMPALAPEWFFARVVEEILHDRDRLRLQAVRHPGRKVPLGPVVHPQRRSGGGW